jgi:hypothetical protein
MSSAWCGKEVRRLRYEHRLAPISKIMFLTLDIWHFNPILEKEFSHLRSLIQYQTSHNFDT